MYISVSVLRLSAAMFAMIKFGMNVMYHSALASVRMQLN